MKHRPPGLLPPRVTPDVIMMVCTAGHVDHGKTALVKLLTGCNTDRLKAEQERGMTIELGFAPCYLGDNLCIGIVDVPGHERFIKNMVAGVSGIEMTILVIAADDGIMPQTIEHLHIMQLLGVKRGVLALTKTDLVPGERIAQLVSEIRGFLQGTFLEGAPICPVSSETLEGYSEFYMTLVDATKCVVAQRTAGVFRMPIERVFSQKGFGVIVSGIPVAGSIEIGAQVEVVPGNQLGRIRGIQVFLRDAMRGGYGQCLALNIPDFNRTLPVRGHVVCLPGYLRPASIFHVRIKAVPVLGAALRNGEQIKLHTGTVEQTGKIYLLEQPTLGAGKSALATIVLSEAIAVAVTDRVIVRRPSPAETVAGGEVIAISYGANRPQKSHILPELKRHVEWFDGVDFASSEGVEKRIEFFLSSGHRAACSLNEISNGTLLLPETVNDSLSRLAGRGRVRALAAGYYILADAYAACRREAESRIRKACAEMNALSLATGDLRRDLDWAAPLWDQIEEDLERAGLVTRQGGRLIVRATVEAMSDAERDLAAGVLRMYEESGFSSPRPDELPERLRTSQTAIDRALEHLCNEGKLIRLTPSVFLSRTHFMKAEDLVVATIQQKGVLNSADFKYVIQSSRKYALAILDYLDSRGVTIRIKNDRKLAPDYQKHLMPR